MSAGNKFSIGEYLASVISSSFKRNFLETFTRFVEVLAQSKSEGEARTKETCLIEQRLDRRAPDCKAAV